MMSNVLDLLAGIGSCLGIAGGYYLVDEEATSELVEEARASVGDSLRCASRIVDEGEE